MSFAKFIGNRSENEFESSFRVSQQLPDRKDIFHNENIQKAELEELEKTKAMIAPFENQMDEPLQKYNEVPINANIRKEFLKCGKENCNDCPHGPTDLTPVKSKCSSLSLIIFVEFEKR